MFKYGELLFKEWMPALSYNGIRAAGIVLFRAAAAIKANREASPAAAFAEPGHKQLPRPAREKGISLSLFSPLPVCFGCLRLDCSGLVSRNLGSFY